MKTTEELFLEFNKLLHCYTNYLKFADDLETPNPEDNRFIKMAMVGFCCHAESVNWSFSHYEAASTYLAESESIDLPEGAKLFSMLALGAVLGMHSTSEIDDQFLFVAQGLLPGYVFGKGADVFDLPS